MLFDPHIQKKKNEHSENINLEQYIYYKNMWLVSKEKGGLENQANGVFPPDKNKIQKACEMCSEKTIWHMVGNGKDKPNKERTNFRGTFTSVKPCFHSGNHIQDGKLNKEFLQSQTLYSSFLVFKRKQMWITNTLSHITSEERCSLFYWGIN